MLAAHFATVVLDGVQVAAHLPAPHQSIYVAGIPLGSCNRVFNSYRHYVFTGCRERQPGELDTLYVKSNPVAKVPVEFWDADGEVYFPKIHIKECGSLRAVLRNRWEDGTGNGGYYSMLHHAQ